MKSHPRIQNTSFLFLLTAAISSCGSDLTSSSSGGGGATTTSSTGGAGASTTAGGAGAGGASGTTSNTAGSAGSGGTTTGSSGGTGGTTTSSTTSTTSTTTSSTTSTNTTIRRPFLVGGAMRSARVRERSDWSRKLPPPVRAPDAVTADLLARSWLQDALEEHASIAAFARFSMQLLALGAPPDLVVAAQRASIDEVRHARACFALAERYGAGERGPAPLRVEDALSTWSLAEVAALTAQEGCVGETLGTLLGKEQLSLATDPEVIAILRRIVDEEARHAELAWRFVRWAVVTGGAEIARAVEAAIEHAAAETLRAEVRSYEGIDVEAFHAHGRVTCHEARAVAERGIREIVRPCAALALGKRPDEIFQIAGVV